MWKILIIVCLASALAESKNEIDPAIVGGRDAVLGQFPYFMSIRYGAALSHGCGSGILNVRFAITAAHCLNGGERVAVAGAIRLEDPGVRYDIVRSFPHPDFHPVTLWNDIGVYQVERDIVYTNLIKPIAINRRRLLRDTPTTLAGHGAFQQHPPWSVHPHLQYLHSNTMSNSECIARSLMSRFLVDPNYLPIIHRDHICAFARYGVGGCFGDSGSPLVSRRTGEVVGVVVSGLSCARGAPDFYARVSSYTRWIESHIRL